jgi:hypothetical protein
LRWQRFEIALALQTGDKLCKRPPLVSGFAML